jgi:hypothetical protein
VVLVASGAAPRASAAVVLVAAVNVVVVLVAAVNVVVARASAGVPANAVGGGRTERGARRPPAPRTIFGWRWVVAESSCTATPVSWW